MRRVLFLFLSIVGIATLTACPSKPKDGECKTGQDCLEQEGYGKVCVEGRCQECGADGDCAAGFICRTNKCVPKPQCMADGDCGPGQECIGEKCVAKPEPMPVEPMKPAIPPECADATAFTIRFDFDKATLRSESQASLQRLSDCLRQAPATRIVAEGHADERGTTQYNIALASRRAEAARKYLGDLGAQDARLETVSFGEERPLCTDSTEACWERNRRVEFLVDR